ncbi:MAG: tyrosine-type recombinase/integrase [Gammaproteobacteria bacterium]
MLLASPTLRIICVARGWMCWRSAHAKAQTNRQGWYFHNLRHTCAAWLVSAGVPLPEVRDLLGHATVKMTERYAHLAPENIRVAVAKLDSLSHDLVTLETQMPLKSGISN